MEIQKTSNSQSNLEKDYSLLYNAAYMLPNLLITLLAAALLSRPLKAYISGQDLH